MMVDCESEIVNLMADPVSCWLIVIVMVQLMVDPDDGWIEWLSSNLKVGSLIPSFPKIICMPKCP